MLYNCIFFIILTISCETSKVSHNESRILDQGAKELRRQVPELDSILAWSVSVDTMTQKKLTKEHRAIYLAAINTNTALVSLRWHEDTTGYALENNWLKNKIDSCEVIMKGQDSVISLFYLMSVSATILTRDGYKKYAMIRYATDLDYRLISLENILNGNFNNEYLNPFIKPVVLDYNPDGVN
jgi:hypothetical protein